MMSKRSKAGIRFSKAGQNSLLSAKVSTSKSWLRRA